MLSIVEVGDEAPVERSRDEEGRHTSHSREDEVCERLLPDHRSGTGVCVSAGDFTICRFGECCRGKGGGTAVFPTLCEIKRPAIHRRLRAVADGSGRDGVGPQS